VNKLINQLQEQRPILIYTVKYQVLVETCDHEQIKLYAVYVENVYSSNIWWIGS